MAITQICRTSCIFIALRKGTTELKVDLTSLLRSRTLTSILHSHKIVVPIIKTMKYFRVIESASRSMRGLDITKASTTSVASSLIGVDAIAVLAI